MVHGVAVLLFCLAWLKIASFVVFVWECVWVAFGSVGDLPSLGEAKLWYQSWWIPQGVQAKTQIGSQSLKPRENTFKEDSRKAVCNRLVGMQQTREVGCNLESWDSKWDKEKNLEYRQRIKWILKLEIRIYMAWKLEASKANLKPVRIIKVDG